MFRSTSLTPSHYAGKWAIPAEDQRIDLAVTNKLAIAYSVDPDSPEKEAKLLQLLENFHGYLMKYLVMIVWGTKIHGALYAPWLVRPFPAKFFGGKGKQSGGVTHGNSLLNPLLAA